MTAQATSAPFTTSTPASGPVSSVPVRPVFRATARRLVPALLTAGLLAVGSATGATATVAVDRVSSAVASRVDVPALTDPDTDAVRIVEPRATLRPVDPSDRLTITPRPRRTLVPRLPEQTTPAEDGGCDCIDESPVTTPADASGTDHSDPVDTIVVAVPTFTG